MSGKHTPGPWRASRKSVFVNDIHNRVVAEVVDRKDSREANAHLLAAAPDLLAALQAARKWLVVNDDSRCQSDLKAVEAAIAKAEGRAP
jgi:hypothetical protein